MSGIQGAAQGSDESINVENEDYLSTGLENFDQAFNKGGIRIGTLVGVISDPRSPSETLLGNMIAKRPAFYFTLEKNEAQIKRNIKPIGNVDMGKVEVISLHNKREKDQNFCDVAKNVINNKSFPKGGTIIFDSVNPLEAEDKTAYNNFLSELYSVVNDTRSLGILNAIGSDSRKNRWVTEQLTDTVLELNHTVRDESIIDTLSVEKLYPGQEFTNSDTQVFDLTRELEIDIASNRNVSP